MCKAWIIFLVYLLAGTGRVDNLVLCFGKDGHISMESSLNGLCCETAFIDISADSPHILLATIHESRGGYCGPCIDIPFMSISCHERAPVKGKSPCHERFMPLTVAGILSEGVRSRIRSPFTSPFEVDSTLKSLRTVVLLI